jgi:hypothetical protein
MSNTDTALTTLSGAFDGPEQEQEAVKPVLSEHPRLQWFNGLPTTTMEMAVGWHIEADVNPTLEKAAQAAGLKRYVVQHKSTDQNGEAKQLPYWALNYGQKPCSIFVVSLGLQSKHQMNQQTERLGIAYGWETVRDADGNIVYKLNSEEPKKKCILQFRAFIQELYVAGFKEWLAGVVSGYISDHLLDAFNEQFRTLDAYASATEKDGPRRNAPFYGFSLPMLPASAPKMVGPQDGDKAPIYPMLSQIPTQIDGTFLTDHIISRDLLQRIRETLIDDTVLWSIDRSDEINNGKATEVSTVVVTEETAVVAEGVVVEESTALVVPHLQVASEDRAVNETELQWIVKAYCMNNNVLVGQVCHRFEVAEAAQLRKAHYDTLQAESAQYAQQSAH